MKLKNAPGAANLRRLVALKALEEDKERYKKQLDLFYEMPEDKRALHQQKIVDIERDLERIDNEINSLKSKVVNKEHARSTKKKKHR